MRLMQHKREAYWFYRYLSIFYDDLVNPLFWTRPMRRQALSIAGLDEQGPDGKALEVIDVGSGTGFTTEGIVEYVRPQQVTCYDQSPHQMQHARERECLQGARFHLGDAEDLPVNTASFDRYVSAGSIEYWPHPERGVAEAYRVLRPGGKATVIGPLQPVTWWGRLLANTWMLFPSEAEYLDYFRSVGFENLEKVYLNPGWYTGREQHFAIAVAGTKPLDGPLEPQLEPLAATAEAAEESTYGLRTLGRTLYRVTLGSTAGGAFIPMALGAKAIAAFRGTDHPEEPLTRAQKSVLVGLGVALVGGVGAALLARSSSSSAEQA